jgi:ubiquinone/menaquinone biosynthesis C-methylase UbiE
MSGAFGRGFHGAAGQAVDALAYDRWVGRWSRAFVPAVLAAANIKRGYRVLDVSTGTGEAAMAILPAVGAAGSVIGADIACAMLEAACRRLNDSSFWPVAADGQSLPFKDGSFDAVVCQLGLQFFPHPEVGLTEFCRVLRRGGSAAACVISTPNRAPVWGILAEVLGGYLPEQRHVIQLSFALADPRRLVDLLSAAGFHDIRVAKRRHEDAFVDFDDYWNPIEAGTGSIPQAYLALSDADRAAVREEVRKRVSQFESGGRVVMSVEMLIASGHV